MSLHQQIRDQLLQSLSRSDASEEMLNNALRLLAKYRCLLIQNTLVREYGTRVLAGPFAGMDFIARSAEGCHIPKLLGCYEEELHPFLNRLPDSAYDIVLNIGCAEGYYAVGLKRMVPTTRILAFDINPIAQTACRELAQKNGVKIEIGGEFSPDDFSRYPGRVLVWCDIEGAELMLLDPNKAPALCNMDLVVELHPTSQGRAEDIVPARFEATHDIEIVQGCGHDPALPPFMQRLGHLDQLLSQWEWRSAPTPWAIMKAKR